MYKNTCNLTSCIIYFFPDIPSFHACIPHPLNLLILILPFHLSYPFTISTYTNLLLSLLSPPPIFYISLCVSLSSITCLPWNPFPHYPWNPIPFKLLSPLLPSPHLSVFTSPTPLSYPSHHVLKSLSSIPQPLLIPVAYPYKPPPDIIPTFFPDPFIPLAHGSSRIYSVSLSLYPISSSQTFPLLCTSPFFTSYHTIIISPLHPSPSAP